MAQAVNFRTYSGNAAENYEKYFVPAIGKPLASSVLDRASLQPGERVLDIACGTGIVSRLAAEQVGTEGKVVGLDLNPGMLEVARSAAPANAPVDWRQADAELLRFPDDSFDVVLCQLGLQFIADKPAAVAEMQRVVAPGGRIVIGVVGPIPRPFAVFEDALTRHIGPEVGPFVGMVFSLHDEGELRDLLEGAGFREIEVHVDHRELQLPAPVEFLWQYVHSTPLVGPVAQADDERRAALERDVVAGWREYTENGATTVPVPMVVVTARS